MGESRRARTVAILCVVLAVLSWGGSLFRSGFSYDDREAIFDNPVVNGAAAATEAFRRDYWHHLGDAGHYRPLATLSLRLDHALHGERAAGYHLTNVLLHAAVVALAALSLLRLGGGRAAPLVGLAVFAMHPVLADSVAWISGRTSMISALGGTFALAAAVRFVERPVVLGVLVGLGIFVGIGGKEDAVVFALPACAVAFAHGRRAGIACLLGALAAVALNLALRADALGTALPHATSAPLAGEGLVVRLCIAGRALLEALRLGAFPFGHPPNYRAVAGFGEEAAALPAAVALLGWLPWLALLCGGTVAFVRRRSLVAAACVLAPLSLVPVLQIVPAGEVFAPRFLYLPLLLFAPALGVVLHPRAVALLALAAVPLAWHRAGVYADRASYATATLEAVPGDAAMWNYLGLAHLEGRRTRPARAAFQRAIEHDPGYSRAWNNLGRLAVEEGDLDAAEAAFRRAAYSNRTNAIARCNLASVLQRRGDLRAALDLYAEATRISPGLGAAWRGLGNVQSALGRVEQARTALRRALELDPSDELARELLRRLDEG